MRVIIVAVVFFIALSGFYYQDNYLSESVKRGQGIFEMYCIACHQGDGKGIPNVYPPLAGSDYLLENTEKALEAVKYGLQGEIEVNGVKYNNYMSMLGLEDQEVADVVNYTLREWGNSSDKVIRIEDVEEVTKAKEGATAKD
ncbi:MAG: cytochrome c [Cyclobacteriaceae bacterium]|nr:cytochrome c [Cyclobacteriaceae bacterium]